MKAKKMFGALTLSAALAMGMALPAFATDMNPEVGNTDNVAEDGTGNTTIKVKAENGNVSATVPLYIAVATNTDGGAYTPPTDGAYRIVNTGVFKIGVKNIEVVTIDNSGWSVVADSAITSAMVGKDADLTGITEDYGKISMKLTPGTYTPGSNGDGTDDTYNFAGVTSLDLGGLSNPAIGTGIAAQWEIDKDKYLPIKVEGQTSRLKQATPEAGTDAFKVKYTIE